MQTELFIECLPLGTGLLWWSNIWASYQIRKIAGCACAGNAGNVFPRRRFQRKPLVSDPGMHHGTYVTHVPWWISGPLPCSDGESVPGIPDACAPAILRIWQEAHGDADYLDTTMVTSWHGNSFRITDVKIDWISYRLYYPSVILYICRIKGRSTIGPN